MEIGSEHIAESIRLASDLVSKTNELNHRLVNVLKVIVISFCLCLTATIVGVAYLYFTTDYSNFGTYNQIQGDSNNATQGIDKLNRGDK